MLNVVVVATGFSTSLFQVLSKHSKLFQGRTTSIIGQLSSRQALLRELGEIKANMGGRWVSMLLKEAQ